MEYHYEKDRIFATNDSGEMVAEILFPETVPGEYTIRRTFVDPAFRGHGIADHLVELAVAEIHARQGAVQATCSYAVSWLENHSQK